MTCGRPQDRDALREAADLRLRIAFTPGDRVVVTARLLGMTVDEPVEVVAVVEEFDRVSFAYRTLPGLERRN